MTDGVHADDPLEDVEQGIPDEPDDESNDDVKSDVPLDEKPDDE